MKKYLLPLFLGAALTATAEPVEYEFSYVSGTGNYAGVGARDTYDVAIFLPGEIFEGYKVLSLEVPVNSSLGVRSYNNPGLFLTTELAVKSDYANNPNIGTYSANISETGTLSGSFDEGYTITSEGIYVGYSFGVAQLDDASGYPVAISDTKQPNSCFLHTKSATQVWEDVQVSQGWGSPMKVTLLLDEFPERNVMIYEIADPICVEFGKETVLPVTFAASSSEAVESIDFDYTFNGEPVSYHYDLPVKTKPGLGRTFNVNIPLPVADVKFNEKETFTVAKVNDLPNTLENSTKEIRVAVIDEKPERQTLVEEYTGTWCPWCTRGYAALEYLRKNYPEFVIAAFHNSDPMQVTTNYPSAIPGYPSVALNRTVIGDPYYGTESYNTKLPIVDDILAMNQELTPWVVSVSHTWDDENTLTANAEVYSMAGYDDKAYKIMYLLVADGLSGTTSSWNQKNNYSSYSQSSKYIDELNAFCRNGEYGKSTVKGLVFNDVVISTQGIYGEDGSLPATLVADEVVSHSMTFNLSKIKSALLPDKNKLRIIAAVISDKGEVMNCFKDEVNDFSATSVGALDASEDENAPVEYYNLNGQKVAEPTDGIFIRRQGSSAVKIAK